MAKKIIKASTLIERRYLELEEAGVRFCSSAISSAGRRFRFDDVRGIVVSMDDVLSFQVGEEVFSVPTKPGDAAHAEVVDLFVRAVRRAHGLVDVPTPNS
jgi:hypothetical protein